MVDNCRHGLMYRNRCAITPQQQSLAGFHPLTEVSDLTAALCRLANIGVADMTDQIFLGPPEHCGGIRVGIDNPKRIGVDQQDSSIKGVQNSIVPGLLHPEFPLSKLMLSNSSFQFSNTLASSCQFRNKILFMIILIHQHLLYPTI